MGRINKDQRNTTTKRHDGDMATTMEVADNQTVCRGVQKDPTTKLEANLKDTPAKRSRKAETVAAIAFLLVALTNGTLE